MGATNILEEVDDAVKRRNRFDMLFEVPLPDAKAREEIFKVHLRDSPHDEDAIDWDALVKATEGYAAGDIETVVNHAAMKAAEEAQQDGDEVVPISQRHLETGLEDVEPSSKNLSGAADHLREPPETDFDDVGGMDDLKQELRELIIEPLENPEMYEQYGLTTANGVLAHGPPGTGKTYTAEALAGELGYSFVVVKPDDIVSKWAGEAPNKMNEVFDVAIQNQPCLVLMDELDAIASERGSATETRTERQTVNQLLTELERIDGEDVIVLATTNTYEDLDPAVVRTGRFDRKIEFPPPDAEARVEILKIHLREPPLAEDIDWEELARETDGLVASDLEAVAEGAARKAIEESRMDEEEGIVPVGQKHIEKAAEEVEPTLLKWRGRTV
jgi:SpoVK/Ycf46/Vps4 family AAA+-type ATPase